MGCSSSTRGRRCCTASSNARPSTVTSAPVRWVFNLNLHPDYFFGNQAYADVGAQALPGTIAGAQREGAAYADNLYRICGAWMQNTVSTPPGTPLTPGTRTMGHHRIDLIRLDGHTDDDLVLVDRTSGVVFAGGDRKSVV